MILRWIKKIKGISFTFRSSILIVFTGLFVFGILSLILIMRYRFSDGIERVAFRLMNEQAVIVDRTINDEINAAQAETEYGAYVLQTSEQYAKNLSNIAHLTTGILKTKAQLLPGVQSVFFANEQGDFVRSILSKNNVVLSEVTNFHEPMKDRKIFVADSLPNVFIKGSSKSVDFDPRTRPWYIATKQERKPIVTDVYQYSALEARFWGITIASPVRQDQAKNGFLGVFALHMRIDYLRHFIESIKVTSESKIFVVTDDGRLIAYPGLTQFDKPALKNITELPVPWIAQSFMLYKKSGSREFYFDYAGKRYLAAYNVIKQFNHYSPPLAAGSLTMGVSGGGVLASSHTTSNQHNWLVGIVAPESDFIGELIKTSFLLTIAGLLILLLGIFIIAKLSSYLVRPLNSLTMEVGDIQDFIQRDEIKNSSKIKEIILLTNALNAMKKGLHSFQKYVPKTLVKQIIEAGDDAKIGGAKRVIVTFFSDIKGFSTIAERTDPDILMPHLNDYFDLLSQFIQREKGTIDKYIGDSIMAFWGAPLSVENASQHAAKGALLCMNRLHELNKIWAEEKLPILETRIGLHKGEAIVGNLGASDRLNYSAIGDAINIASRLENANKLYNTHILVSNSVYEDIKDKYILRIVDHAILKGKTEASYIYELLAENGNELNFDIEHYKLIFADAFNAYKNQHWSRAILYFEHCLKIYPADQVSVLFIIRCQYFKLNPPPPKWQGEWHISWNALLQHK